MADAIALPIGVSLSSDIEYRSDRPKPYKARVRWINPVTKKRRGKSESFVEERDARAWIDAVERAAARNIDSLTAIMPLTEYGEANMSLAMRGLEQKTMEPYMAGWRKRVVPTVGHLLVSVITNGVVDRAVHAWIVDECSKSTIKNSLAALVRVMEQARRDGLVDVNRARIKGWQSEFQRVEDELDDPRALALTDWETLENLADALVERSADKFVGWGKIVKFKACTASRIGEVSGVRARDIDRKNWMWNVRRQTTPGPGGLIDKGTKGKRAREVHLIREIRPMVDALLDAAGPDPMARLFTSPRGGRVSTAVLHDATHWDEVVMKLGFEHLRRHDLRHTGLTWMADAGVPLHVLRLIARHGSLSTTQRYLHSNRRLIKDAGDLLSAHLSASRSVDGPRLRVV